MLGRIINVVTGKPQQYINENILRPLGMNDSKWEYTEVPKEKFAPGYRWENEQWKEEPVLHDGIFGAGRLICSSEDFSKYVAFHLSAWPPRDGGVLRLPNEVRYARCTSCRDSVDFHHRRKISEVNPAPPLARRIWTWLSQRLLRTRFHTTRRRTARIWK